MKLFLIAVLTVGVILSADAPAQNSELPSAPSATLQERKPTVPGGGSPAATPAPEAPKPGNAPAAPAAPSAPAAAATDPSAAAKNAAAPAAGPDPENEPLTTIVHRVDEVSVIFTVTDKHGKFIKDLTQNDFTVLDDHKPPKSVVNFRRETDLPLRVGLLIDASNSVRDRFHFEQESAIEFLSQTIRPASDRAFIIGFDTTAEVTQDFTGSTEALARGIRLLRPGGGTAMFDAIYFACRDKLMKAPQTGPVRRAIILLSDGEDNQSRVTREEAVEMAQRAEVIIYAISTNVSGVKLRGDKVMERMADATGGRAFFPYRIQDVANAFENIQDELRSQYALAYKPADFASDGRYRSIEILAQNHKNLRVRARKGYYSPKP